MRTINERTDVCRLCDRETDNVTDHHLVPKCRHRQKRTKKMHTKEERRNTVPLCQPCHRMVHRFFTEKELADSLYTIEGLKSEGQMHRHIRWIRKQKRNFRV